MAEDQGRLIEINRFLKKQNEAVMKMLEGYAALHFYYQQLFTKRSKDEVVELFLEFNDNIFKKIDREIESTIFFFNPESFEFEAHKSWPASVDSKLFESELYQQTEEGVVGWSITNQKISFFESSNNERYPHGMLMPLYTPNKTLGLLIINVDSDASFVTHETLQILELACSQTSLFVDNLEFV